MPIFPPAQCDSPGGVIRRAVPQSAARFCPLGRQANRHRRCHLRTRRIAMSSASGSHAGGSQAPVVHSRTPLGPDETCSTTSVIPVGYPSYCRVTRTCRSCLDKIDCMINSDGKCVSLFQGGYTPGGMMNYRRAFTLDLVLPNATESNAAALQRSQQWLFPSADATYCPADDAVCQQCIAARFWIQSSSSSDSRFCVGKNGCVCISDCEDSRIMWGADCSTFASTVVPTIGPTMDFSGLNATVKAVGIGVGGLLMLVAALLYYCVRRDYIQRQRQDALRRSQREALASQRAQQRQQRLESMGASMISLSGWRSHRQSLIDKETHRLTLGTEPSELESSTPYTLTIDDEDSTPNHTNLQAVDTPTGESPDPRVTRAATA